MQREDIFALLNHFIWLNQSQSHNTLTSKMTNFQFTWRKPILILHIMLLKDQQSLTRILYAIVYPYECHLPHISVLTVCFLVFAMWQNSADALPKENDSYVCIATTSIPMISFLCQGFKKRIYFIMQYKRIITFHSYTIHRNKITQLLMK